MNSTTGRVLLATACAFVLSCGEAAGHPDQPYVAQAMLSSWDVDSLKEGDWVEHEEIVLEEPVRTRMACVAVEEEVVWIEYTGPILFLWEDTVLLFAVYRKDRLISKAIWGAAGQVGREVRVDPQKAEGATSGPGRTGTGVVSEEKLTIKEKDLKCEKIALDYKSGESHFRNRTWTSADIPFRYSPPTKHLGELKWEGKAAYAGGLVRREVENPANGKIEATVLVGWGRDARRTLKLK